MSSTVAEKGFGSSCTPSDYSTTWRSRWFGLALTRICPLPFFFLFRHVFRSYYLGNEGTPFGLTYGQAFILSAWVHGGTGLEWLIEQLIWCFAVANLSLVNDSLVASFRENRVRVVSFG